eukprot:467642-Prymnesium_polylepis.1
MDSACLSVVGGFIPPPPSFGDGARPLRLSTRDRGNVRVHSGRVATHQVLRVWRRALLLLRVRQLGRQGSAPRGSAVAAEPTTTCPTTWSDEARCQGA